MIEKISLIFVLSSTTILFLNPIGASSDSEAHQILSFCAGGAFACAVSEIKQAKCWGRKSGWGLTSASSSDSLGDDPKELGDNISYLDFGKGLTVESIYCGGYHICARLSSGDMKCLGNNYYAQIGVGIDTNPIGAYTGFIGENLPVVNLGKNIKPLQISLGSKYTCTKVTGDNAKCFGNNWYGQLGLGSGENIGDHDDMGDKLPYINFGKNVKVKSVHAGVYSDFSCAILLAPSTHEDRIKCWGQNYNHQLGYGDSIKDNVVGVQPSQMGDNLPLVNIGSESRVKQLALGQDHTCALLMNDVLKCWGQGTFGQLGSGSSATISATGNKVPEVLIDQGKKIRYLIAAYDRTCLVYSNSTTMKCFGWNLNGQLGQGDKADRGSTADTTVPHIKPIDFGSEQLEIQSIHAGQSFNCIVFEKAIVKCFGDNLSGQLAIGSFGSVGDKKGDMGNNLKPSILFGKIENVSPTQLDQYQNQKEQEILVEQS